MDEKRVRVIYREYDVFFMLGGFHFFGRNVIFEMEKETKQCSGLH